MTRSDFINMLNAATIEAITMNAYGTAIGELEDYERTGWWMDEDCTGVRAEAMRREKDGIVYVSGRDK